MSAPTFTAFKLVLEDGFVFKIQLLDLADQPIMESTREIRVVNSNRAWLVYLISIIPLVAGLIVISMRRKKVRDIKVVGVG